MEEPRYSRFYRTSYFSFHNNSARGDVYSSGDNVRPSVRTVAHWTLIFRHKAENFVNLNTWTSSDHLKGCEVQGHTLAQERAGVPEVGSGVVRNEEEFVAKVRKMRFSQEAKFLYILELKCFSLTGL